jgi:phosphatidylcholine synthase
MDRDILYKRGVNAVTAVGGAISAASLYFAFEGRAQFAWALMGLGIVIDAVDGTLVRLLDLSKTLPRYDGERLDEYADLITFVIAPVGFAWAQELLPFSWLGIGTGMVVIAVSTLQFSRQDNKTENAFWGWPSFWNIAYFYAWAAEISSPWVIGLSLVLSVGVFVPIPFAYPSRLPKLRKTTIALGVVWGVFLFAYLIAPDLDRFWLYVSLAYPVYYFGLSAVMHDDLK